MLPKSLESLAGPNLSAWVKDQLSWLEELRGR